MKRARTTEEMRFAAAAEPCPMCRTRNSLGALDLEGVNGRWRACGVCSACGTARSLEFATSGNPSTTRARRFELGPGASELITPEQFLQVLDEATPMIPDQPTGELVRVINDALTRALTSVTELLKLVPEKERMPGAADLRLQRATLEREYIRLKRLLSRHAPPNTLDAAALDAHAELIKRGVRGPGCIDLVGKRMVGERYGGANFTAARFANCDLTNADLAYTILDEAHLDNDTLTGASLDGASITHAVIRGGTWTRARFSIAKFNGAEIHGTDFTGADMERSTWYDAKVRGARFEGVRFGNAVFDRSHFEGCSFRAASFAKWAMSPTEPTSGQARFVDCDVAGSNWAERDLSNTTFVRCKLAGAIGKPAATHGLVLQECDLDVAGFLAQVQSS